MSDKEPFQERIAMLEHLDGIKNQTYFDIGPIPKWRKTYHNSKMKPKALIANDLVLLYDIQFQKNYGQFK